MLHLHVAEIVLLASHLQIMLCKRKWSDGQATSRGLLELQLGMLVLSFWRFRRATIHGFYAAYSVAIAALVPWAFAVFSGAGNLSAESESCMACAEDSEQTDDVMFETILLDRPIDEEHVQQFIRTGRMRIHMVGVGDLYGRRGHQSVLGQGCKLLSSLPWGVSSSWLLQRLADVSQKRRKSMSAR